MGGNPLPMGSARRTPRNVGSGPTRRFEKVTLQTVEEQAGGNPGSESISEQGFFGLRRAFVPTSRFVLGAGAGFFVLTDNFGATRLGRHESPPRG